MIPSGRIGWTWAIVAFCPSLITEGRKKLSIKLCIPSCCGIASNIKLCLTNIYRGLYVTQLESRAQKFEKVFKIFSLALAKLLFYSSMNPQKNSFFSPQLFVTTETTVEKLKEGVQFLYHRLS